MRIRVKMSCARAVLLNPMPSTADITQASGAMQRRRLTIFGRSLLLIVSEITANVVCWVVCAVLFRKQGSVLGLALLSWVRSWFCTVLRSVLIWVRRLQGYAMVRGADCANLGMSLHLM
jgi:hypothetical protein